MSWQSLFEATAEFEVSLEDVQAALAAARRDASDEEPTSAGGDGA